MQTQILRRVCDNPKCNTKVDLVPHRMTPMMEAELGAWIVLTKEHVLQTGQEPQAMTKMACRSTCAIEIIKNNLLDVPKITLPPIPTERPAAN